MAGVFMMAREPVDLSRESNGEMALAFDVLVEEHPSAPVVLRMDCGEGCSGALDVSESIASQPPGEWGTIAVRLRCFEDAGADMKRIAVPFALATDGTLALRFSNVKLVSAAESEAECP